MYTADLGAGPVEVESGVTTFPLGDTEVTITATGGQEHASTTSTFTVYVVDTTAPAFYSNGTLFSSFPGVTVEAVDATGAIVDYTAQLANIPFTWSAEDAVTPTQDVNITYSKANNTRFDIGLTIVTVTATDAAGNSRARSLAVRVLDRTAPVITQHANVEVEPDNAAGATVIYDDAQTSDAVGVTSVTYSKNSNTVFPVGVTTVTITAKDAARNTTTSTFTVTVASRPLIAVEQPLNSALTNGQTVDFGPVNTGTNRTLTFTIRSTGVTNLNNLTVTKDGASANEFTVTGPASTPLAPPPAPNSRTFTVKFTPASEGERTAAIHIESNAAPFDITLKGTGFNKPAIDTQPITQLVAVGESASFTVAATGSDPLTYQWLKNGVAITTGATGDTYTIPTTALTDGAGYSVKVTNAATGSGPNGGTAGGTVTSTVAKLGVYSPATDSNVSVNEGATLTLKASVGVPPGTIVTYLWKKDGTPIANSGTAPTQVISGAATGTLSITKAATANEGSYACDVTVANITKTTGKFNVTMAGKPVVNQPGPFSWTVSSTVSEQLTAQNTPTSFAAATVLPTGVSHNTTTGQLSGKPTTAGTGSFTVTATSAAGTSAPVTVNYTVAALPAATIGTFNGLVDRSATLSLDNTTLLSNLGGTLKVITTSTGAVSGSLVLESKTHALTGRLDASAAGNPTATLTVARTSAPSLTLALTLNRTTGELTGTLSDGTATAALQAWRNPWSATAPATAFSGVYTAAMEFDDPTLPGDAAYPQGASYGTLTITGTTGQASWTGKMADGTAITNSTSFIGPDGQVPVHFLMYAPTVAAPNSTTGSVHGWLKITTAAAHAERLVDALNDQSGDPRFDWYKPAQPDASTTRSYKAGIPLHKLTVTGGGFTTGSSYVLNLLGATGGTNNAQLVFTEGGIADSATATNGALTQLVSITSSNTVSVPIGTTLNPARVTFTLNAATGALSGAFRLTDGTVTRDVTWAGLLIPRLQLGVGNFQLPQLTPTVPTSDILSGQVVLEKKP